MVPAPDSGCCRRMGSGVGGAPPPCTFLAVQAQTSACLRACPQFTNRGNRRRASVGFADPAGERRWLAPRGGSGVNSQFGREHQPATARVPACALDPAGCAVSPCCPPRVLSGKGLPGAAPPLPRVPVPESPVPETLPQGRTARFYPQETLRASVSGGAGGPFPLRPAPQPSFFPTQERSGCRRLCHPHP